jgi:fructokinase
MERVLDLGPRMIAITLGAEGAMAASQVGRTQLPADRVDVVDTVGSGDSFSAGLIASLHEQDALALDSTRPFDDAVLETAVSLAISVAALTSTRTGAAPPSREELDAYLSERVSEPSF